MNFVNKCIYLIGAITTIVCLVVCIILFIVSKSKDKNGSRIELENKSKEKPWKLSTWIAGVFVAGTGVALMYAPSDLLGYIEQGLNPTESIVMVAFLNGAPVWRLYSVVGIWYMKHMDSKIGKIAAMLSTILGMSISLWTGMRTVARFIGLSFPGLEFLLATITILIAMFSAKKNLLQNISRIAFVIFVFAFLSLISIPNTEFEPVSVTGGLTSSFFKEYFLGATSASWIFWFISWTPTVSRWLANISKGRTMREYISGTILLPTTIAFIWMIVSWKYQNVIMSFNIVKNVRYAIPCLIFIISGMFFMIGTLDSDCKVFTEDFESIALNKVNRNTIIPFYGIFVLFFFCMFISGIVFEPFAFNEYSSLLFLPMIIWSIYDCISILRKKKNFNEKKSCDNKDY